MTNLNCIVLNKKDGLSKLKNNPYWTCDILYIDSKGILTFNHTFIDKDLYDILPCVSVGNDIDNIDILGKSVKLRGYFNNFRFNPVDLVE